MPFRNTVVILLGFLIAGSVFCQRTIPPAEFDSVYKEAVANVGAGNGKAIRNLESLSSHLEECSPVQKAKISFLRFSIIRSDRAGLEALESQLCAAPDSLEPVDSLIYSSARYLERSMPDKAIPLLLEAIGMLPENSDKKVFCVINLCEAYREKQEYAKGISMLSEVLKGKPPLSDENRAYANSRMAALFNESGYPPNSFTDSVFHYAERCLALSERIGSLPNLAASQNELSFQYLRRKEYKKALDLAAGAVENFTGAGMPFHAMNALINQSKIHIYKKEYGYALRVIEEAMDRSGIEQNRNLYMRLFAQLAKIYQLMGKHKDAFELLEIGYRLQSDFFKDRINRQINEQSAKYDLLIKEQKIREEQQINAFQRRKLVLLLVLLFSVVIASVAVLFYIRLRRKAIIRQHLMEAVVETETRERKRIARDLHDGLGPVLSAINHYFQAFLDARPEDREPIRNRMQQVISESIEEVSRISHNISPTVLENHGLITALNNFISPLSRHSKIEVDFVSSLKERLELKKELTLYRCVTELFHNTMKHADATRISLRIETREHAIRVSYSDDGKGFDPERKQSEGMGLGNIRYRIESVGGILKLESIPGKGTRAMIELPF